MSNFLQKRNENGFTMVELIITIAILSFGIIGVYSAFSPFVTLTYNISLRFAASYLGQEGVEIVRNIRDNNFIKGSKWSKGLLNCDLGCQADYKTGTFVQVSANKLKKFDPNNFLKLNSDGFYSYDLGVATPFKRKITINQISKDVLKVTAKVLWDYNGKSFSFEIEEYLYNWH